MAIPNYSSNIHSLEIGGKCFVRSSFIKYVLEALLPFYGKDDKGNKQKPKLGVFDGYSYDKMYTDIEKEVKKIPENKIVSVNSVRKIMNILKKYKGEKSPNKKEYVDAFIGAFTPLEENVKNTTEYIKYKVEEWESLCSRDLCGFATTLEHIQNLPDAQRALKIAISVINKRNKEEQSGTRKIDSKGSIEKNFGLSLLNKYKNYIEK